MEAAISRALDVLDRSGVDREISRSVFSIVTDNIFGAAGLKALEARAWVSALNILISYIESAASHESESSSVDLNGNAEDQIQQLINNSLSPKPDFKQRVSDFVKSN